MSVLAIEVAEKSEKMLQDGYVIFNNVISPETLQLIKKNIHDTLVLLGAAQNDSFAKQYSVVTKKMPAFEVNIELRRHFNFSRLPQRILRMPIIFDFLIHLLGPDLAFLTEAELPVNVKGISDTHLVKKYHQEFWSGAGYRSYVLWSPLIFPEGSGGLEIVKGSHLWGHIPHRNRAPIAIPDDAEYQRIDSSNCGEQDIILFHSLTLHRTIPNQVDAPRLAYATHIRNILEPDTGFEVLKNWEIFNLSATSRILKACGNPHLSPFRTHTSPCSHKTDTHPN